MKSFLFPLIVVSILFFIGCSQENPEIDDRATDRVSLSLIEATPLAGEAPLKVFFVVYLLNMEGFEEDYYCPPTTWDFGDGEHEAIIPTCLPYADVKGQDEIVQVYYTTHHIYSSPGTYRVQFTIKDLISDPVTITVREDAANGTDSCTNDSDCVPAQCCHPTDVVNARYAPNCSAVSCDASCQGPLDCGAGKPVCKKGMCIIEPASE